jgi:hypothetical protein
MKLLTTVGAGAAAMLSLGLATHASAYSLNPKSTSPVTVVGPTTMSLYGVPFANCTATLVGGIDTAGYGTITSAVFSGSSACASIAAQNLPWDVMASGLTGTTGVAFVNNVNLAISGTKCTTTAGVITAYIDNTSGNVRFSGTVGACDLSGSTLASSPQVSVSNP